MAGNHPILQSHNSCQKSKLNNWSLNWNIRSAWQQARKLSGRQVGPKQPRHDRQPSCRPTVQDWTQHVRQAGPDGGCKAHVTGWDQHLQQHTASASSWHDRCQTDRSWRRYIRILAQEDVSQIAQQVWYAKARKGAPFWTAPNEVWRIPFYPSYKAKPERTGVAFHELTVSNFCSQQCLHTLFVQIRCSKAPPWIGTVPNAHNSTNKMENLFARESASSTCWILWENTFFITSGRKACQLLLGTTPTLQGMPNTGAERKTFYTSYVLATRFKKPKLVAPHASKTLQMLFLRP